MRLTGPIARVGAVLSSLLLASATVADETADAAQATYTAASLPITSSMSATAFLGDLGQSSEWRLSEPVDLIALAELHPHPLNELHFEDSDLVSRLSKLRGLSMLTMAEIGPARLFFGVNDEGLVGLHFNTGAGDPDDVHVEVLRMPYLDDDDESPTSP